MLRAVLFDFDFTLADSSRGVVDAAAWAMARMGQPPPDADRVRALIGRTLPDIFDTLVPSQAPGAGLEFKRLFIERADQTMDSMTHIYPEALATVRFLRDRGQRTAIVSTKLRRRLEQTLTRRGLEGLFDVLIGVEDVHEPKPDPAGLLLALEHLRVAPDEAAYVGDHGVDAEAARRAGLRFVGVETGPHGPAGFPEGTHSIPDIAQLPAILGLGSC